MIYLDNAATTKPSAAALEKAAEFLSDNYFNPSAPYGAGFALQGQLKKARTAILSHVCDVNAYELVFTSCGTESDNTAIFSCCRRGNAVTTEGEHSAVLAGLTELKNRNVIDLRTAGIDEYGRVRVDELLDLIDDKTTFVSVMHVNNETGAINDVNAIAKAVKCKNPRVLFHSDGVQAFGKIPFRLSPEIDFYSISAHKIGGLKGVGALIKKKSAVLHVFMHGGGQENGRRSGTENVYGIKVLEYAAEEKYAKLRENFSRLKEYKSCFLQSLNGEIYTPLSSPDASPYIISVSAKGLRGEVLLHMADEKGLIVGAGSACSSNSKRRYSRVVLACGYDESVADGVLRISFSTDTTKDEVLAAAEILNEIGAELSRKMN